MVRAYFVVCSYIFGNMLSYIFLIDDEFVK